ncbi:MAG: RNA polymerase-binding protein RbpA [Catenulispora sp.]|nr:RNA polymerase-binding protein RbpA [Catenulispora sp.]
MARSAIRGSRIGAGPTGENERGPSVTRIAVTFWCAIGHSTSSIFAASAEVPEMWDCHHCDRPAGLDQHNPPAPTAKAPYRTHLAYVRERRSDAEAEIILAEALTKLRTAA